jgi:hypothetical protein
LRLDSIDSARVDVLREKTGWPAFARPFPSPNATNRKQHYKTMFCDESSLTAACYLCDTLAKTAGPPSGSFIACTEAFGNCDVATEGASRGRPVLGGSLLSTHPSATTDKQRPFRLPVVLFVLGLCTQFNALDPRCNLPISCSDDVTDESVKSVLPWLTLWRGAS